MLSSARRIVAAALAVIAFASCEGCERQRPAPPVDTVTPPPAPPADTAPPPAGAAAPWIPGGGPVLVVRGGSAHEPQVVLPQFDDSTAWDTVRFDPRTVRGLTLDLLDRSGLAGQARVDAVATPDWGGGACVEWPGATIAPLSAGVARPDWTVAFAEGRAQPIPLDSIETLPRADSARLAAEMTRLASALPDDPASRFHGLPFTVRAAYRFAPAPGVQATVADAVRKIPVEASPLEEHTLLIAERDSAAASARWQVVYSERVSGTEERIEATELLAAVLLGEPRRPVLVLTRAGYETTAYALLERTLAGRWRVRWTSARTGC